MNISELIKLTDYLPLKAIEDLQAILDDVKAKRIVNATIELVVSKGKVVGISCKDHKRYSEE